MRDYTGLDSIISPLFCLFVMVTVWSIERMCPSRDILFFIPKSWRMTEPLYQLTDGEALKETAGSMQAAVAAADTAGMGKDVSDPAGESSDKFDVNESKKKRAAVGKRPDIRDDSAHAGRRSYEDLEGLAVEQQQQQQL